MVRPVQGWQTLAARRPSERHLSLRFILLRFLVKQAIRDSHVLEGDVVCVKTVANRHRMLNNRLTEQD